MQFNNLKLGEWDSGTNTATLTVNNTTATFNGYALVGPYDNNDSRGYYTSNAVLNVTGTGVLNVGGSLSIGGNGNPTWTPVTSSVTVAPTAQLNLTGLNTRLRFNSGTYGFALSNTPGAGKLSVNSTTDLWLANQIENGPALAATLNVAASSSVQFRELQMAWNEAQNATATLNLGASANVSFSGRL